MPKNVVLGTKTIVTLALLAALSIVLTRLLAVTVGTYRFSIGNMPIVLSGILFGPLAGALTGFVADFLGASMLGTGWTPQLMVTPILMGLIPGVLRFLLKDKISIAKLIGVSVLPFKVSLPKLLLVTALPYIIGSMLYSTYVLSIMYGMAFMALLPWRVVIYIMTMLLDTMIIFLLIKSNVFKTLGFNFTGGKKDELRGNTSLHP